MNNVVKILFLLLFLYPGKLFAAGIADSIQSYQSVLDQLYTDMLPKASSLISVARALAGFAALWYIAFRVWGHIARAEPVDFYPLLRPFALGMAIALFPQVLGIFNGVLNPITAATRKMVNNSDAAITELLKKKDAEMRKTDQWKALVGDNGLGDRALWMEYAHPTIENEGWMDKMQNSMEFLAEKISYNFTNEIKYIISVILQIIYSAAALCINTLRTFNLVILAILGPLILAISIFDGFHHTLNMYVARYINVFLWLPVANILGAVLGTIEENILKMDLKNIAESGTTFFSTYDVGYIIFMAIGIVAYTTVPSIADQIIHVGGGGAHQHKVTQGFGAFINKAASPLQ